MKYPEEISIFDLDCSRSLREIEADRTHPEPGPAILCKLEMIILFSKVL